jgi:hypothetical protein
MWQSQKLRTLPPRRTSHTFTVLSTLPLATMFSWRGSANWPELPEPSPAVRPQQLGCHATAYTRLLCPPPAPVMRGPRPETASKRSSTLPRRSRELLRMES